MNVVALVFEQLSTSALQLVTRAARSLVERQGTSGFAGLFTVDRALHVVTEYTISREDIQKGLEVVSRRAGQPRRRAGHVPGAEYDTAAAGAPTRETKDDVPFARGLATIDALSAIVEGLRPLPGRKVVVLFSEGLALDAPEDEPVLGRSGGPDPMNDSWLTDNRYQKFMTFLERANAARVVFYTFDAAGLRTESPFASLSMGRAPYVGLQLLAEQTGGAFVESTNDLEPGVRRAWDDQQHHYVLGYTPAKSPDDSYRKIRVTVDCPKCTVLARKGYRATVRKGLGEVGQRDVAPLLFLERGAAASDLPSTMDVRLVMAAGSRPVVRIAAEIAAHPDAASDSGGLLTILARVRGERQRLVAVLSQHFDLAPSAAAGRTLPVAFSRDLELPPGEYSVDVIGYQHSTGRATTYTKAVRVKGP
jgi:VWFA-related protein